MRQVVSAPSFGSRVTRIGLGLLLAMGTVGEVYPHTTEALAQAAPGAKGNKPPLNKPLKARGGKPGPAAPSSPTAPKRPPSVAPTTPPAKLIPPAPLELQQALELLAVAPEKALTVLLTVLEQPALHPHHRQTALRLMGKGLDALGFPALALWYWELSLEGTVGPKEAEEVLSSALPSSLKLGLAQAVAQSAALLDPVNLPEPARGYARYHRGLALQGEGELKAAVAELVQVPPDHPARIEARLSMANVFTEMRRRPLALVTLQDALKSAPPITPSTSPEQRAVLERLRLNLARAHYAMGQAVEAADEYAQIPRTSLLWLTAQQELAWAWYRVFVQSLQTGAETGQQGEDLVALNRSLGVLHGLTSPFFADAWLPEPTLLEIQLLFQLCRVVDGSQRLKAFQARYTPELEALTQARAQAWKTPEQAVALLLAWRETQRRPLSAQTPPPVPGLLTFGLLERFQDRPDLAFLERQLEQIARERVNIEQASWATTPARQQHLKEALHALELSLRRRQGEQVLQELDGVAAQLKELLQQSQIFELNLLTAEKELYQAAAAGNIPRLPKRQAGGKSPWPADRQIWPFEGEYWADEVGYYQGDARPLCPE